MKATSTQRYGSPARMTVEELREAMKAMAHEVRTTYGMKPRAHRAASERLAALGRELSSRGESTWAEGAR